MLPVTSAETTRALDQACIDGLGVPGRVLMELAGRQAAARVHAAAPGAPAAVACGPGNNGGDGYVIARWLHLWGHEVRLWASADAGTPDAAENAALCARMGLVPRPLEQALGGAGVVIDALLGTGQSGPPRGAIAAAVAAIAQHGAPVFAIDLPTGVHSDTGQALGPHPVQAAETLTLGRWKPGLLAMPGAALAGRVTRIDIGLSLGAVARPELVHPDAWLLEATDVTAWVPRRDPGGAKWDRGHVAIRGGGGASVLAALGAFAAGAGLVTVLAARADWPSLHGLPPAAILAEPDALDDRRHDTVVVGPGLGRHRVEAVRRVWQDHAGPVVADADALTVLARPGPWRPWGGDRVITPHSAEAARLLGCSRAEVEADRFGAARRLGDGAVLKGPHTLIGGPRPWVNPTGTAALATAGTGDVLAGMIGGMLARGLPSREACALACWLHGEAGRRAPENATAAEICAAVRPQPD